jgi:sulfatase modifying factor 1
LKVLLERMFFARRAVLPALAAVVGLSLASAAGGESSARAGEAPAGGPAASTPASAQRSAPRKKALTKRKKRRRVVLGPSAHPTSRLTLASSADLSARDSESSRMALSSLEDGLVDEAGLPAPVAHGACPPEMASIERRYCVDRWEGSLVETGSGGERPFSPFLIVEGHEVRAASVSGVFPQGYISGSQAQAACERAGKRLCSTNEWRKACVGPKAELYGYAHAHERGRCNDGGRSPMLALWGGAALTEPSGWDPLKMNDPRLNQIDGGLARTGSHPSCTNDYGVFDMVGNLHEWTSDPRGTFQGGYFLDTSINGEGCSYRTTAHDFDYHDYSTGFRCCKDPI